MTEESIVRSALEKGDPTERAAYLDAACTGDPGLRQRVEGRLRSHLQAGGSHDAPAAGAPGGVGGVETGDFRPGDRHPHRPELPTAAPEEEPVLAFLGPSREPGHLGRLGHYEVLEVLGRGGMGVVFRAFDDQLHRVVAIKVLAPVLIPSATARQRFLREARAAAAIRDAHVVGVHEVNGDGPLPYLVMEFIAGVTLADRVKAGGPPEVREVLRIGMQMAEGLAAAHRQGVIHRDVKPGNILLEDGARHVKITDFGLARAADDAGLTQSGVIAGTPLYMSPEQARGEALDHRSDLFSLGSVLYLLCTGCPAFQAGNTMAVLKRVCDDAPPPIRELNPEVPDWLAALVGKLLAKDPANRFQSAAELAELLGRHLANFQQPSPPERKDDRSPTTLSPEPRGRADRKGKRLAVAAVLVVVAAASLGTVMLLRQAWLFPPAPGMGKGSPPDPRVLTVSKNPEGGGRFRSIRDALDEVDRR
jgi:serine/threonine protein kinase